jgi:hypothetical protein
MGANSPEAFWRSGEPQKTTAIPHSLTKAGIKRQNFNTGHIFFALFVSWWLCCLALVVERQPLVETIRQLIAQSSPSD